MTDIQSILKKLSETNETIPTVSDMKEYLIKAIEQLPDDAFDLDEYAINDDGSFLFIDFIVKLGKNKATQIFVRKNDTNYNLNYVE